MDKYNDIVIFGVPLAVMGIVAISCIIRIIYRKYNQNKLKANAVTVKAELIHKRTESNGPRGSRYVCKFIVAYRYEGKEYESMLASTLDDYQKYSRGDILDIYMMPNKPETCFFESYFSRKETIKLYAIAGVAIAMCVAYCIFYYYMLTDLS